MASENLAVKPEGEDEEFTHAAHTLVEFTTLPEGALLRAVKAGLRELSSGSLEQVEREARALREAREAEEVQRARETLADLARKTGLGPSDLFPELVPVKGHPKQKSGSVKVKYRGPEGQGWSGRGHHPKWLKDEEALGRTKEDFAVGKQEAQSPTPD